MSNEHEPKSSKNLNPRHLLEHLFLSAILLATPASRHLSQYDAGVAERTTTSEPGSVTDESSLIALLEKNKGRYEVSAFLLKTPPETPPALYLHTCSISPEGVPEECWYAIHPNFLKDHKNIFIFEWDENQGDFLSSKATINSIPLKFYPMIPNPNVK